MSSSRIPNFKIGPLHYRPNNGKRHFNEFQWNQLGPKYILKVKLTKFLLQIFFSSKRKEILGNESWGHHVGKFSHFIKILAHSVLLDDFEKGLPSGQEWFLRWYWDESHIVDNDHYHDDGIMYDMAILMTMTMLVTMVTIIGMTMIWQLWRRRRWC